MSDVVFTMTSLLLMELKEQAPATTLARRLGDTAHVSGLAIRLARLSGAGDRLPEWLLKTAMELCLGQMPDEPWLIRAAAQLLSSPRVEPERLVRLAVMERVEPVLLHIAAVCARVY